MPVFLLEKSFKINYLKRITKLEYGSWGPLIEEWWFSTQSTHWAELVNHIYVVLVNIFF